MELYLVFGTAWLQVPKYTNAFPQNPVSVAFNSPQAPQESPSHIRQVLGRVWGERHMVALFMEMSRMRSSWQDTQQQIGLITDVILPFQPLIF